MVFSPDCIHGHFQMSAAVSMLIQLQSRQQARSKAGAVLADSKHCSISVNARTIELQETVYKLLMDSICHRQQTILCTDAKLQWQCLAAEAEKNKTYRLQPICLAKQETSAQLSTPESKSELQG